MMACNQTAENTASTTEANPFLEDWNTPYGTPPFDQIKTAHYEPAFEAAFAAHNEEVKAIAANPEAPDFANTIEAFDLSGSLLRKVNNVFGAMESSMTDDALQAVSKNVQPKITKTLR